MSAQEEINTIEINGIKYVREDSICNIKSVQDYPYKIGAIYLIRTVTMIDTGRLVAVTNQELVLEDAAWIADTGRFSDALKKLSFNEVEPFLDGRVIVGRGAIVDAQEISAVQRSQK